MKKIIICSCVFLCVLAGCRMTNTSGSKDAVKNGQTSNGWNSRRSDFQKSKYKKNLKQSQRIKDIYDGKKRFIFF